MTPITDAMKAFRDDAEAALATGCLTLEQFVFLQRAWSAAAFGPSPPRGPIGPLKHLAKEVGEALAAAEALQAAAGRVDDPAADPARHGHDVSEAEAARDELLKELVDCWFLVSDALWRAGFGTTELRRGLGRKLLVNRARSWPPMPPDAAVEHDRSGEGGAP